MPTKRPKSTRRPGRPYASVGAALWQRINFAQWVEERADDYRHGWFEEYCGEDGQSEWVEGGRTNPYKLVFLDYLELTLAPRVRKQLTADQLAKAEKQFKKKRLRARKDLQWYRARTIAFQAYGWRPDGVPVEEPKITLGPDGLPELPEEEDTWDAAENYSAEGEYIGPPKYPALKK